MTDDRVERLESRIRELEATINGLTDELVDAKGRVQALENAAGFDGSRERGGSTRNDIVEAALVRDEEAPKAPSETDASSDATGESESDTRERDERGDTTQRSDDIIVA